MLSSTGRPLNGEMANRYVATLQDHLEAQIQGLGASDTSNILAYNHADAGRFRVCCPHYD